jgi:hypothetical protein
VNKNINMDEFKKWIYQLMRVGGSVKTQLS